MRVLIVSATSAEITPFLTALAPLNPLRPRLWRGCHAGREVDVLVTGVGMVPTAAWVARTIAQESYDLAIDLGLCGSFDPELSVGQVVHVISEHLSEVGAEDGEQFITLQELGLIGADEFPYQGGSLVNRLPPDNPVLAGLPAVRGITVNTVHGHEPSIAAVTARCYPQVESMEGAAFLYACLVGGVPCAQVRAVSNLVERRNRDAWRIGPAVDALNETALALVACS
jgi:futalosine hydrolase